jgi:hypothetical protein
MGIPRDDGRRGRLDDVSQVGVGKVLPQSADGGRRKDDVANLAQANQKNPQFTARR